jgi:pre-rRNA-processing protein IPI1
MAKKKTEKQKDFVKKKLKVGKKLTNSNETSISFNSKKIKLANQRKINQPIEKLPSGTLNPRLALTNQEFVAKVSLLKHYSNVPRKETLITFIKIFDQLNQLQLINLIKNSLHLFIDPDFAVREEFGKLLELINEHHPDIIIANLNNIMLYLINGITHILRDIKLHTGKFLLIILSNKLITIEKILMINNKFFLNLLNGILDIIGIDRNIKSTSKNSNLIDKQNLKLNNSAMSGNVTLSKKTVTYKLNNLKALQMFLTKVLKRDVDSNDQGVIDCHLPSNTCQPYTRLQLFSSKLAINNIKEWNASTNDNDNTDFVSFQDFNARVNVIKDQYFDIIKINLQMIKKDFGFTEADRKGNSELGRVANNCLNILEECL